LDSCNKLLPRRILAAFILELEGAELYLDKIIYAKEQPEIIEIKPKKEKKDEKVCDNI